MKFVLALLAALSLTAQTATTPTVAFLDQVQGRSATAPPMIVAVIKGKVTNVQLDQSIVLNTATNPPTLSVLAAKTLTPQIDTFAFPTVTTATTLTLPFAPAPNTLACYRNGLRLSTPGDFTQSGTVLTLAPGNVPQAGDVFTCDSQH